MSTRSKSPSVHVRTNWLKPVGFALAWSLLPISAQTTASDKQVSLEPIKSTITVVEKVETESPAFITVLDQTEVREQPGVNIDDRLRSIPGFTLFRRTSSVAANPTTQGVSLRGLGSSGASRSLVLWDGIPVNDPFGGWVYWTRIPPDELERVELSRGAATSVFGDRAMSGAISLFSRPAERLRLTAGYEGGNKNTHMLTGGLSHVWNRFGVSGNVRAFTTDGYYVVQADRRGAADTPAGVRFVSGVARVDYSGAQDRLFLKMDVLTEERANGTVLTQNSTSLGTLAGHYTRQWADDTISVLGYHTRQEYHASFSAVSADRNTERITFLQSVPATAEGGAGMWRHHSQSWNLLAGADAQRVEGTSTDTLMPTGLRVGGGSQVQHGTFAQFDAGTPSAKLFLGARHQFTGTDRQFFSPSGGFTIGRRMLRARGSVYRAFRAPTLNELFRDFRAGIAETRSNPALLPETLFGAEVGVDVVAENTRFGISLYRNQLDDVITNVTLSQNPQLIVRQRRNAAQAVTRGVDAQWEYRWRSWRADLGYLYAESRFSTRERIPQVPKHSGNAQLTYSSSDRLVSFGLRSFSLQFEDDRNQFLLPGYATLQFAARQRLRRSLWVTASIENLLDRTYLTGIPTPTAPTIGAPMLWRAGLRWDGPIR
jgi:outer membrane cobalamin receptor